MVESNSRDLIWLDSLYYKAFPHLRRIEENKNALTQKLGVDKYFFCPSLNPIKIEEKYRYDDYGDLLLEDYSNWKEKTPGWARDSKKITDFLSYIIIPSKKIWIFVYPALRKYFLDNYDRLFFQYVINSKTGEYIWGKTRNRGGEILYTTANIPVPLEDFPDWWFYKYFWEYN